MDLRDRQVLMLNTIGVVFLFLVAVHLLANLVGVLAYLIIGIGCVAAAAVLGRNREVSV